MSEHDHQATFFEKVKAVIDPSKTPGDGADHQLAVITELVAEAEPTGGRAPLSHINYSTLCLALKCYDDDLAEREGTGDNAAALAALRERIHSLSDFFAREQGLRPHPLS